MSRSRQWVTLLVAMSAVGARRRWRLVSPASAAEHRRDRRRRHGLRRHRRAWQQGHSHAEHRRAGESWHSIHRRLRHRSTLQPDQSRTADRPLPTAIRARVNFGAPCRTAVCRRARRPWPIGSRRRDTAPRCSASGISDRPSGCIQCLAASTSFTAFSAATTPISNPRRTTRILSTRAARRSTQAAT